MSKSQALLVVKMAKEFEKIYLADVFAVLDNVDSEMDEEAQDETSKINN